VSRSEMTDKLTKENTNENAKAYLVAYQTTYREWEPEDKPSYLRGFTDSEIATKTRIAEQLLCVASNLSLSELAAAVYMNEYEVLDLQTKLLNDEPRRLKNKLGINERIAKLGEFTNSIVQKQSKFIAELRKDIAFLFKHIKRLNEVQDGISTLLDDAKEGVWCENDIKERNRAYSTVLRDISNTLDEFADTHIGHVDEYLEVVDKYKDIIEKNKHEKKSLEQSWKDAEEIEDADDNAVSED